MKRIVLVLTLLTVGAVLFAQVNLPEHRFASGNWAVIGQRLYQNDEKAPLAKMNVRVPQSSAMLYEFDARYEGGAEDGHGGFGLHIFADSAHNGASWGVGNSYLLWFNYDEKPLSKDIPQGFSAQVYRSYSHSRMDLVQTYDLNDYAAQVSEDDLDYPAHIKIIADGNTGTVQVYDPIDSEIYYELYLDKKDLPMKGNWVALRTNGIKLSFTD
jgi:disulfide oxidoreductase YuzD